MASSSRPIRVLCTSYYKDFSTERKLMEDEVVPELQKWAKDRHAHVQLTHITWGGQTDPDDLVELLLGFQNSGEEEKLDICVHISSTSLGLVPMWGDIDHSILSGFRQITGLTEVEMELIQEIYKQDVLNAFYLLRTDWHPPDGDPIGRGQQSNLIAIYPELLEATGMRLSSSPLSHTLHYSLEKPSTQGASGAAVAGTFVAELLTAMKARLKEEFADQEPPDAAQCMKQAQAQFVKACAEKVRGRQNELQQLEEYVLTGGKDVPVLLLGSAGSGKTSILAKLVHNMERRLQSGTGPWSDGHQWLVLYHFVGAVPDSSNLQAMLYHMAQELGSIQDSVMTGSLSCLAQLVCSALCNVGTKPVLLIVDGLEQFDEDSVALLTSWIPRKLGPNIRCILSLVDGSEHQKALMSRESKPQEFTIGPMETRERQILEQNLASIFDRCDLDQLVSDLFGTYRRCLNNQQMSALVSNAAAAVPLWLVVACEELRLLDTDQELERRMQQLPGGLLELLVEVLGNLEHHHCGSLIIAVLSMLECSATGLTEEELRALLADPDGLSPPSPYDEKDEKESSEKEGKGKKTSQLSAEKWNTVYKALQPFIRPYGEAKEGKLYFYHRILSKGVRQRYFRVQDDENMSNEESQDIGAFWHQKMADFFENCDNIDRKVQEYLHHLVKLEDESRLCQALCDWKVIDRLYSEEYSATLLMYWRKAGGAAAMIEHYRSLLETLEEQNPRNEEQIALRHEHIARIFLQAGKYPESRELTKVAMKLEEKELGNRPERMVELYGLMSEIFDEKSKLNDFVSPSQLPELRKTISYGRKSIELRKTFSTNYHKFKLGLSLMKLAFSLESWEGCGGDEELSGEEALREGNMHIDTALTIFKELGDDGHYAEALMTKGVLAPRGSLVQLKFYNEAMEICMQVYGEHSLLTSRLYINIGIVYEDNKDYVKAYECFCKWAEVSEIVLGPTHPKTLRAKGVLKEPRYRLIAMRLKRQDGVENDGLVHNDHISESSINQEVEELDDDYSSLHQSGIAGIESDDEERADGEPLSDHSDLPRSDIQELYLAFSDLIHQATLAQIERAQNVLDEVSDVYDDDSPGDNRDTEE